MDISAQSKGEEKSFFVTCDGPCKGVDIKVEGSRYDSDFELFALEHDKPSIDPDERTCFECANFCSSRTSYSYGSEKSCENIWTASGAFYVTVYARYSHRELKLTIEGGNILDITKFGEF